MTLSIRQNPAGQDEIYWPHFNQVKMADWQWPNFTPKELACRSCKAVLVVPSFLDMMQSIRTKMGVPFNVTSGYRSPEHNAAVSGTKKTEGPHVSGQAMDIAINYGSARSLLNMAFAAGFMGIGIRQHGHPNGRYIHLDMWHQRESEVVWTYDKSRG